VRKKIDGEVAERYEYNQANQLITRLAGGTGAPAWAIDTPQDKAQMSGRPWRA